MGKDDFLTPKAIGNMIRAKGLQKLKWYCQMCEKQCRDENGFKCHCMSESHQRQMEVYGQDPDRFVGGYSEKFESAFLEHMKRSHRFSRVAATVVYNEFITDRRHIHMNSTQWLTLAEFVKYLGRTGKCKVEETPKGLFMTYIDRDPEKLFMEKLKNKRLKSGVAEEERLEREIKKQIEKTEPLKRLVNSKVLEMDSVPAELKKSGDGGKIVFELGSSSSKPPLPDRMGAPKIVFEDSDDDTKEEIVKANGNSAKRYGARGGGSSAPDELMKEQEKAKERSNRKGNWLHVGIVVKVMSKGLANRAYYRQKGVVKKLVDKYTAEIEMLENKHKLRVDQEELETVIPRIEGLVRILNGAYRGSFARLLSVSTDNFCAKVQIEKGIYHGRVLPAVEYEDICKVSEWEE